MQLSLFEPVFDREFDSDLERKFALYLDEQKALKWWHRVAVRQRADYYLRGWRQERIWPDFVALAGRNGAQPHVLVFETKGEHLRGSADTDYKEKCWKPAKCLQCRQHDHQGRPGQRHLPPGFQREPISRNHGRLGARLFYIAPCQPICPFWHNG